MHLSKLTAFIVVGTLLSAPAFASRLDLVTNVSSSPNQWSSPATLLVVADNSRGTNRGIFAFDFPGTNCASSSTPQDFALAPEVVDGAPTGAYIGAVRFAITCQSAEEQTTGEVQLNQITIGANGKFVSLQISMQLTNGETYQSPLYPVTPRVRVIP